jgi:hypothetical protein
MPITWPRNGGAISNQQSAISNQQSAISLQLRREAMRFIGG